MSNRAERLHAIGHDIEDGLFSAPRPAQALSGPDDVAALDAMLLRDGGWVCAEEIAGALGWADGETGRSRVRDVASHSDNVISGPGTAGYRHAAFVSVAEFDAVVWKPMWSQIRKMVKRLIRMCRRVHGQKLSEK